MGLDLSKFPGAKDEASQSSGSSLFRNISFCSGDSHAEEQGIPIGNLFLNEGDSGDLDNSTITDLGISITDIYILDHFQYMEFRDPATEDLAFTTLQYKVPFNPIIIRDIAKKEITALPFWSEEGTSVLNSDRFEGTKRSNRYNISALVKLDGEWKRVKIKASASTIYGADFDKENKRPSPKFKAPMEDSLEGFMKKGNEAIKEGFWRFGKCKLSVAKVGSKNHRMTFEFTGETSEADAEMITKNINELKEAIANENGSKLAHFAKEMVNWAKCDNKEFIAACLQNPIAATYNSQQHFKGFMLGEEEANNLLVSGAPSESDKLNAAAYSDLDEVDTAEEVQAQFMGAEGKVESPKV